MRQLFYHPTCPMSRAVRLCLYEKKLDFSLVLEKFFERRKEFLDLNPLGTTPVLIDLNGTVVSDGIAILEYLDELYPQMPMIGDGPSKRAEARRLMGWFHQTFAYQVTIPLIHEKIHKRLLKQGCPDGTLIRKAKAELVFHVEYISWLCERRNWMAGKDLSFADIVAASHLSIIDFMGDIFWDKYESAKGWYMRIKSRPSFRPLLYEVIPGIAGAPHYSNLDF